MANLSKRFLAEGIYIALIQEPWVVKGKIMGLGETGGKLIYCKSTQTPRTCILLRKILTALPIHELCSRDLTAVKVQLHKGSTKREIILTSGYLPYDDSTPPPSEEVQQLLQYSTRCGSQILLGYDANAHHMVWGSTNTNQRSESLLGFIMANNLTIVNQGNKPAFITAVRKEVLDVTIITQYIGTLIKKSGKFLMGHPFWTTKTLTL
jgi:hypothetical protein